MWGQVKRFIWQTMKTMESIGCIYGAEQAFLAVYPEKLRKGSRIYRLIDVHRNRTAMRYLEKYLPVIERYDYRENGERIGSDSNIWVLWWQGHESAPDIVKACVDSIRKNAGSHPVICLDRYNYEQYVALPDYIIAHFEKGDITVPHLSDIIRSSLLHEYGGIWLDATIYMLHPLDKVVEGSTFYSVKHLDGVGTDFPEVRQGYWTGFFLACGRRNPIVGLLNELFLEYWRCEETLIIYLLIDYFIAMIYRNVGAVKNTIDGITVSNRNIHELAKVINKDRTELRRLWDDGTYIYKLTYKRKFLDSIRGGETIYHMLVHSGWDGANAKSDEGF